MKLECFMWEILNLCRHEILLGFRTHETVLCFIWCFSEQVCLGIFFLSLRFCKLSNANLPIFLKNHQIPKLLKVKQSILIGLNLKSISLLLLTFSAGESWTRVFFGTSSSYCATPSYSTEKLMSKHSVSTDRSSLCSI